jgi:methionyl-tRNA formyltransferase
MRSPYHVVFMGTPGFAVPSLEALAALPDVELAGVVTQPDRPAGRGRRLTPPPVKFAAERLDVPIMQVTTLRDAAARQRLEAWQADAFIVAAFGLILGRKTLAIPRIAAINVHASLLPAYRGASPVATAIARGEHETGVTLMRMDPGLDTGPMYAREAMPIAADDTTGTLTERLAQLGADMVTDHLPAILAGDLTPKEQIGPATLTRPLTKADGWLDWSKTAIELERQVRAMSPWPRAWTTLPDGTTLQGRDASVERLECDAPAGTVHIDGDRLLIACGADQLIVTTAQPAGGRPVRGVDLVRGRKLAAGDRLGVLGGPEEIRPLVETLPGGE